MIVTIQDLTNGEKRTAELLENQGYEQISKSLRKMGPNISPNMQLTSDALWPETM